MSARKCALCMEIIPDEANVNICADCLKCADCCVGLEKL